MTQMPALRTVVSVVSGAASPSRHEFVWGEQTQPFSVGRRGLWLVDAPGVPDVQFYLAFDGRQLHISPPPGPPDPVVSVGGAPLSEGWSPVSVNSDIVFHGACFRVHCEEIPAVGLSSNPPHGAGLLQGPRRRSSARDTVVLETRAAAGASGAPPGATSSALPGDGAAARGNRREAPPTLVIDTGESLVVREDASPSTMSDGGALRNLAERVAASELAGSPLIGPPGQVGSHEGGVAFREQRALPEEGDVTPTGTSATKASALARMKAGWRGTSWPMRITMIVLPFAGYFAVIWEPAPEPRSKVSGSRVPAAAPASASGRPTASATTPATNGAATSGPASSSVPAASSAVDSTQHAVLAGPTPAGVPPARDAASKALDAAFEDRLTEAAIRYEELAKASRSETFALAAKYARERAVRVP